MKLNKALLLSYVRHLGSIAFGVVIATAELTGRDVVSFTKGDWILVANSFWLAVLPIIKRFVSKKFPDFGIVAK